jgi:hypothetical protein
LEVVSTDAGHIGQLVSGILGCFCVLGDLAKHGGLRGCQMCACRGLVAEGLQPALDLPFERASVAIAIERALDGEEVALGRRN